MKEKINRVNLYQNYKNAIFTTTSLTIMSAISSAIAAGVSVAGGYTAVTNIENPTSASIYGLMSLALACVSAGRLNASINSLKNTRNLVKLRRDMTNELENASVENEDAIVLKYNNILDGGANSWSKRNKN